MEKKLEYVNLPGFELKSGAIQDVHISYQIYGRTLHTAPIILVNHALTGNSSVLDWWSAIVGSGKAIDLDKVTVLILDIPGNGFDRDIDHLIYNYQKWRLSDVASAFAKAIQTLNIQKIDYGVGGSIGGGLLWEMLVQQPDLFGTIIPIAADWKATDWLIACCEVQNMILETSSEPLQTARAHAMTFYRSPQGLKQKFNLEQKGDTFKVVQWLHHHGKKLQDRFTLPAYRLMNHLLMTLDAKVLNGDNINQALLNSETSIEIIAIDSDGFFVAAEDRETYAKLNGALNVTYHEINSPHGHDAFLIEYDQVSQILKSIIKKEKPERKLVASQVI